MCIICLALDRNKITIDEAIERFDKVEPILEKKHAQEVSSRIGAKKESWYQQDFIYGNLVDKDDEDLSWLYGTDD